MILDDFFPHVLVDVPGCPDPTVRLALLSAVGEFCRKTLAWTEIQDPMPLVSGVRDYDIDAPSQAYTIAVSDVWLGARRLKPMTMLAMQDTMPNWATAESNEPIYYNSATEHGVIRIFPIPANVTDQTLVIRAAYAPTATATTVPDFLGQQHIEVIASGALARLMIKPGAAWANPQLGDYHQKKFTDGIADCQISEAHDRNPGTIKVQPRSFGF